MWGILFYLFDIPDYDMQRVCRTKFLGKARGEEGLSFKIFFTRLRFSVDTWSFFRTQKTVSLFLTIYHTHCVV